MGASSTLPSRKSCCSASIAKPQGGCRNAPPMSAERLIAAGFSRMAWMDEMVLKPVLPQGQSTRPPRKTLENRASTLLQRPPLMMKQLTMKQPSKKQLKVAAPPPAPAAAAVIEAKIEEVSGWIKSFFSSGSQPVLAGATSAAAPALAAGAAPASAGKGQRGDNESGAPIDPALSATSIRNKAAKWQKATNAPLGPLAPWTLREHFKFGGGKRVIDFFRSMDADGSGEVTIKEFGPFVKFVGFTEATDDEIAETFKALDVDGSGRIPYVELDKKLREKPPKREPTPKPPLSPEVLIKKEIVHGVWPAPPPPPAHTTWRPREYDSRYFATTQEDPRYTLGRERPSWGLHVPSRHVHEAYSDDEPFVMADGTSVATGELDERLLKQSQLVVQRPRGGGDSAYAEEFAAAKIAERNPSSSSPGQPRHADPIQPGLGRWAERLMSERVGWVPEPLNGTPVDVPHSFKAAAAEEVLLRVKELKARQTRLEAKRRANDARKGRARTASPQPTPAPTPTAAPAPPPGAMVVAGGIQISSTLMSWVPDPLVVPSPFHAVPIDMLPAPTDGVPPPDAPKTPKAGAALTLRADGKMDLPAPPDLRPDLRHRTNSPSSARSAKASSARGPTAFHAAPVFQGPLGHPRGSPSGATPRSPSPGGSARAGTARSKSDSGPSPRSSRVSKTSARDSKGVDKAAFRASLGFS